MDVLDNYVRTAPSPQAVLDIFDDEWSSTMPSGRGLVSRPGPAALFEDARIHWASQTLGGFAGKAILELGPLEGAHSYMCQQLGARRVVAIEANTRAFLKCLCVKEIFDLRAVSFLLGDFNEFAKTNSESFDICIASGVLYHCPDPLESLALMARNARSLFIWTHYYDAEVIQSKPEIQRLFQAPQTVERDGQKYTIARRDYKEGLQWQGFCGGPEEFANWMERESILRYLNALGFGDIKTEFDHPHHPNGPAFALCARR